MVGLVWLSVGCKSDGRSAGSSAGGASLGAGGGVMGLLNRESKSCTLCSSTTISELPALVDGAI